jgi:RHS repeat-associated protein
MYTVSERTDFDGFGHYRHTRSSSNFAPENVIEKDPPRYAVTRFNPGVVYGSHGSSVSLPAASSVWLKNLYDRQERWVSGSFGQTSIETFAFNSSNGLLQSRRSRRGANEGATDFKTIYSYDSDGNLTQESHFGGKAGVTVEQFRTKHAYTAGVRRLTEAADPVTQQVILRSLDLTIDPATGRPTVSRDMAGVGTVFTYDGLFRTLSELPTHAGEAGTYIAFTPANGLVGAKVVVERRMPGSSAALTHAEHHYDGLGRVARQVVKRPGGALVEKCNRYRPQGWLEKSSVWRSASLGCGGGLVWEVANSHDVLGRVTRVARPDGSETTIIHDGIRERLETTTPLAAAPGVSASAYRRLRYDSVGNLSVVTEPSRPNGSEAGTEYFYDEANRLVKVRTRYVDGGEYQERLFDYDGAGVLLSEQHPEMGREVLVNGQPTFEQYTWGYGDHDALRNPGTKLLLPGVGQKYSLGYRYDRASRLSQVYLAKSDNPYWRLLKQFSYANDETALAAGDLAAGKMVAAKRHHVRFENPGGYVDREVVTETFEYAGLGGRLSRQELRTGGAADVPRVRFASSYGYDSLGNLNQLLYPECNFARCGFEQGGQLISVADERIQAFGYSQGALTSVAGFADLISYHPNGQLAQVLHSNQVADVVTDDPNGLPRPRRIATQNVAGTQWDSGLYTYDGAGNVSAIGTDTFAYDRVNRLRTSATTFQGVTHNQAFTYDLFGNLTSMGVAGNEGTRTFTVDERTNHLVGNASVSFLYDPVGNLSLPGWSYDYDAFTLLLSSAGAGSPKKYLYTAADERVATLSAVATGSVVERWSLRAPGNGVLRDFERLSDSSWRLKSEYLHRGGRLLAEVRHDGAAAPQTRHLHLDHLGTPRLVTDDDRIRIAEHKYLPFGEELGSPSASDTRLKFTGHERDDLDPSGQLGDLDYMHARYYTPLWGRFLSLDPGRDWDPMQPQSWSLYTYVRNRPVNDTDPTGKCVGTSYCPISPVELAVQAAVAFQGARDFLHGYFNQKGKDAGLPSNMLQLPTTMDPQVQSASFKGGGLVAEHAPTPYVGVSAFVGAGPVSYSASLGTAGGELFLTQEANMSFNSFDPALGKPGKLGAGGSVEVGLILNAKNVSDITGPAIAGGVVSPYGGARVSKSLPDGPVLATIAVGSPSLGAGPAETTCLTCDEKEKEQ